MRIRGILVVSMLVVACASTAPETESAADLRASYRRPTTVPQMRGNESTRARVALGRTLFFDPRLSRSGTISCATCHDPGLAWGDGMALGRGHAGSRLSRRTPTILNSAWTELLMWDGRFESLEEQALGPIQSQDEMAMPLEELETRLRGIPGYVPLFEAAYPGEPITAANVGRAIAVFERGIVSGRAPFDVWVEGDATAISSAARRGFALFNGEIGCAKCHSGWRFTDDSFYDIGVVTTDRGRGRDFEEIEVLQHAFKTPTLRNVTLRAPYMHNGSEATLADVIDLYARGGRAKRPSLSPEIQAFSIDRRGRRDLLAFLETLTSDDAPVRAPELPR